MRRRVLVITAPSSARSLAALSAPLHLRHRRLKNQVCVVGGHYKLLLTGKQTSFRTSNRRPALPSAVWQHPVRLRRSSTPGWPALKCLRTARRTARRATRQEDVADDVSQTAPPAPQASLARSSPLFECSSRPRSSPLLERSSQRPRRRQAGRWPNAEPLGMWRLRRRRRSAIAPSLWRSRRRLRWPVRTTRRRGG